MKSQHDVEWEEVPRPDLGTRGSIRDPESFTGRLRATAETGKAIRVKRGDRAANIHGSLRKQGFILRTRTVGEDVICWCEKIEKDGGGDEKPK